MSSGRPSVAARAPNHLGDGILALPALHALAGLGDLTIHAPPWGAAVYRDVPAQVVPRGPMRADAAILFPPSLRAALEARRCRRRVGVAADGRRLLLTDVVEEGTHRADTYAALAAAVGARAEGPPRWRPRADDPLPDVPDDHVGLNPITVGPLRDWGGWLALADRLDRPVVFYGGPGEDHRVAAVAGPHRRVVGLPLPAFARALERCAVFVSNDSGAAHFARAVGRPTVVIFGSTTAARTGPHGAVAVEGPELPCRPCYGRRCAHGLACFDIPVEAVLAAVRGALP